MAGFSQGAIELKKKNSISAAPNDFIKLSINTDNIPYTVDENGVYRYLNYYNSTGISSSSLSDLIDNGNGTATILSATARLYSTNNFTGNILEYSIPSATFTLTDGVEQYICVSYNSGTPIFYLVNDKKQINESNMVCVYCCWRQGNEIHSIGSDSKALGLSNKISLAITDTIPYRKSVDGGLVLSESIIPNPRTVLITSANVYAGVIRNEIGAFNSSIDRLTLAYHSSGIWLYQDNLIYNNTQYDDGTNLQTIGNNKYAVRWFYRSIGDIKQTFYVLGLNQYNNISDARLENPRSDLPIVLRKHCILIARIIVEYNASSGLVENIADVTFSTTSIQNHNDLANIQGGSVGNYYHVSANTFSYLSAVSADIQQQLNSKVSSAGSPTNHNNLLNLQGGSSGNYYHVSASTFGYLSAVSADIQQQLNSKISSAAAPTNHNNLLGLQGGSSGNYYHVSASTFGYLSAVSADIQQQLESKVPKDLLNVLQEPTGFINRTDTKLLFNDATRTFTISALTSSFDVYYRGNKFTKTTESIVIPNVSGLYFIYYSSAGILSQANTIAWDIPTTIQVAIVYWTGTSSLGLCDERHGTVMDCATHAYLHTTFGTRYERGFDPTYTLSNDSFAFFGVSNGVISDEDLRISISQGVSGNFYTQQINYPGYFPVFYREGTDGLGTWRKDVAGNLPYKHIGTGRVSFNELSGSTWKQTETSNNNFVAYYIYATDEMYQPIISVQGQRQDGSLIDAKNNNVPGTLSFTEFPIVEAKLLYRIIVQTNASYTGNPFYARIADVTDYRNQLVSTGSIIGGTGTVTYVGLSGNPIFTIAGTPITNAGTFTIDLSSQSSGTFLAGPSTGTSSIPTFRKITSSDIPPISNFYLPLSGGQLYGQMRGTSVSASGNISANNFVGNLTGYKNVDNTNEVTIANGYSWTGDFFINYRGATSSINEYKFCNGKGEIYSAIRTSAFIKNGGTSTQLLVADGSIKDISSFNNLYLPLSGGQLYGQMRGTSVSASGNISANNFVGNLTGYKNVDNTNEVTIANGYSWTGDLYINYRGSTSSINEYKFCNGKGEIYSAIRTSAFIKDGGTATQLLLADGSIKDISSFNNLYLPLSGGTMIGDISFINSTTGVGKGIYGTNGDNDHWRIIGGSTVANFGYLEIATDDDQTEPIYVRQYLGTFASPSSIRTLTLLDQNGNTNIPGNLSANNIINRGSYYVSNYATGGNPSLITNQGLATFYTLNLDYYSTGERSLKFADSAYLGPTYASFFNNGSTQNNAIVLKGAGNSSYGGLYFGIATMNPKYIGTKGDDVLYIAGPSIQTQGTLSQTGNSTFVGNTTIGRNAWLDENSMTICDKLFVSGTSRFTDISFDGYADFYNNSTFNGIIYSNSNINQDDGNVSFGGVTNAHDFRVRHASYFFGSIYLSDCNIAKARYGLLSTTANTTIDDNFNYQILNITGGTPSITLSDSTKNGYIKYIYNRSGSAITVSSSVTGGLEYSGSVFLSSISLGNYQILFCMKLSSGINNGGWIVRVL